MQCFQNSSVFASKEKTRNKSSHAESASSCVSNYSCPAVTLKIVSLPTFIRTLLTGHLFFWDIWGGWAAMAQRCHPRQCTLRIYLWEGFWNGFLLGQTCEIPATARGNHFRTFACLGNFHLFICCTGIRLLVEEQKMAETVLADLIITEIH